MSIRLRWYRQRAVLGAGLLLLPLVPGVGYAVGGARIWVSVGPINFQPGEFAKILLSLFFAGYLYERRELIAAGTWHIGPIRLPEPRHFLPILAAWAFAVVVMVGQRDLGSSLLFFTLFVVNAIYHEIPDGFVFTLGNLLRGHAVNFFVRVEDMQQVARNHIVDSKAVVTFVHKDTDCTFFHGYPAQDYLGAERQLAVRTNWYSLAAHHKKRTGISFKISLHSLRF